MKIVLNEMSDESILGILELMLQARNGFLNNDTIRALDFNTRGTLITRFMNNDIAMLEFLNRMYIINSQRHASPTAFITLNMPAAGNGSFMEPVVVTPTSQQIDNALENMTEGEGTCAVCQDAISTGGCRIRHCTHGFHRVCITNWFTMSVRCPVCRYDVRGGNQGGQTSPASSQTSAQLAAQLEEH